MSTVKQSWNTNPIIKNLNKPSRTNAIKAMCAACMGCTEEQTSENFRSSIRDCTSPKCPLYPWRPYQRKQDNEQD